MIKVTTSVIVIDSVLYVRIPANIVKHRSFNPTNRYEMELDAQGGLTLVPK